MWNVASQFDNGSINDDNVPQCGRSQTSVDDILIITMEDTGQQLPMRQKVMRGPASQLRRNIHLATWRTPPRLNYFPLVVALG